MTSDPLARGKWMPEEPTQKMLEAAFDAYFKIENYPGDGPLAHDAVSAMYRAMFAAYDGGNSMTVRSPGPSVPNSEVDGKPGTDACLTAHAENQAVSSREPLPSPPDEKDSGKA